MRRFRVVLWHVPMHRECIGACRRSANKQEESRRIARGIRKVAADGSSLKLVGAEVVSQPPTISQIMPASAATDTHDVP